MDGIKRLLVLDGHQKISMLRASMVAALLATVLGYAEKDPLT